MTETDPLDPDSDSARTAVDEADNGVLDGLEDFDNDSLATVQEALAGTDPFDADTDGDTLLDATERFYQQLDGTLADSDGDGVRDDRADPDNDTLTTKTEVRNGTNPFRADTDRDGLDDDTELALGTDPTERDSDGDGLSDGEERDLGTDPTAADTDGDGVVDGNESFTTTTANESLGVSVAVTGQGDLAEGVTIQNGSTPTVTSPAVDSVRASPIVDLESEQTIESADVTVPYDVSGLENASESNLVGFRFNRSLATWLPVDTTVDTANDTATLHVEEFSRFVLFDAERWESFFGDPSDINVTESDDFTNVSEWAGDARLNGNGNIVISSRRETSGGDGSGGGGGGGVIISDSFED